MLGIDQIKQAVYKTLLPYLIGGELKEYRYKDTLYITYHLCKLAGHKQNNIAKWFGITKTRVYYGIKAAKQFASVDKTYKSIIDNLKKELNINENQDK